MAPCGYGVVSARDLLMHRQDAEGLAWLLASVRDDRTDGADR